MALCRLCIKWRYKRTCQAHTHSLGWFPSRPSSREWNTHVVVASFDSLESRCRLSSLYHTLVQLIHMCICSVFIFYFLISWFGSMYTHMQSLCSAFNLHIESHQRHCIRYIHNFMYFFSFCFCFYEKNMHIFGNSLFAFCVQEWLMLLVAFHHDDKLINYLLIG